MEDADTDLAMQACVFGCVGTAGQRCTSTRRIFIHETLYDKFVERMINAYKKLPIGDPLDSNNLMGPLHTKAAVKEFTEGLTEIQK